MSVGTDQCSQRTSEDRWFCVEITPAKKGVYAAVQEAENSRRRAEKNVTAEGMSAGGSEAVPQIRTQCRCGATTA